MPNEPAGWYVDPTGRHVYRYWDGTGWSQQVSDGGSSGVDPIELDEATATPPPAPGTMAPGSPQEVSPVVQVNQRSGGEASGWEPSSDFCRSHSGRGPHHHPCQQPGRRRVDPGDRCPRDDTRRRLGLTHRAGCPGRVSRSVGCHTEMVKWRLVSGREGVGGTAILCRHGNPIGAKASDETEWTPGFWTEAPAAVCEQDQ